MPGTEVSTGSNPLVAALLQGTAPRPLRISAARGVLPLARAEQFNILVVLLGDEDEEIRHEAASRLGSFPEGEVLSMLGDPAATPTVLDHFGCDPSSPLSLKEAVLANGATPASTLRRMLPTLAAPQIDQVLLNQTRLIAEPDLLDFMSGNPALTPLQRTRIEEFRRHFLRGRGDPQPPEGTALVEPDRETLDLEGEGAVEPLAAAEGLETHDSGADGATAELLRNAAMKILRMNAAERIKLAFKGTREERSILIKDTSRSVQQAVLHSPKLTESEVEAISKMRNVGEDVLRTVAGHRDWIKNYVVVHSLATNPKTPTGIAVNLVGRLNAQDLRLLVKDKNVPEGVRRQARTLIEKRRSRPEGH